MKRKPVDLNSDQQSHNITRNQCGHKSALHLKNIRNPDQKKSIAGPDPMATEGIVTC